MNKLYKQLGVLVLVTGVIIVSGVFLPRIFITNRINKTSQMQESVMENEVSPYGEEVVDTENKLYEASRYIDYVIDPNAVREYEATMANDPAIDEDLVFTEALMDTFVEEYGYTIEPVRFRKLLTADNIVTHISEIYDGTLNSSYRFLTESNTGLVLYAKVQFPSSYVPSGERLDSIISLYSEWTGINFVGPSYSSSYNYAENGVDLISGAYSTTLTSVDGNMELIILTTWEAINDIHYGYTTTVLLSSTNFPTDIQSEMRWYADGV